MFPAAAGAPRLNGRYIVLLPNHSSLDKILVIRDGEKYFMTCVKLQASALLARISVSLPHLPWQTGSFGLEAQGGR